MADVFTLTDLPCGQLCTRVWPYAFDAKYRFKETPQKAGHGSVPSQPRLLMLLLYSPFHPNSLPCHGTGALRLSSFLTLKKVLWRELYPVEPFQRGPLSLDTMLIQLLEWMHRLLPFIAKYYSSVCIFKNIWIVSSLRWFQQNSPWTFMCWFWYWGKFLFTQDKYWRVNAVYTVKCVRSFILKRKGSLQNDFPISFLHSHQQTACQRFSFSTSLRAFITISLFSWPCLQHMDIPARDWIQAAPATYATGAATLGPLTLCARLGITPVPPQWLEPLQSDSYPTSPQLERLFNTNVKSYSAVKIFCRGFDLSSPVAVH